MKKIYLFFAVVFLSACASPKVQPITISKTYEASSSPIINSRQMHMVITSPDFQNNGLLPQALSCLGEGRPPVLEITDVPSSTLSLALIVQDPDAPAGVFTHWLAWNIDPHATTIDAAALPAKASSGVNSSGSIKYVPPCPPSGIHHYYYRLYALDAKLTLPAKANVKQLLAAMNSHIIDEAVIMGRFQRGK